MGRGKRSEGFRATVRQRLVVLAAEEQVREAGRWAILADDEETQSWAREGKCIICGGERKRGTPLCSEHYEEALRSALAHIEQDSAHQERAKTRSEKCRVCDRKSRYRCGVCMAKGTRPKEGFLWCWSCHGLGEWGSDTRFQCEVCNATGYLSEADTRAKLGAAFPALEQVLAAHGRELRTQRLNIWEHEEKIHGLDLSDRDEALRYEISFAGGVQNELVPKTE